MRNSILLFGLGNAGEHYEHTYHNIGALFSIWCADEMKAKPFYSFKKSETNDRHWFFALPETFMNESGLAVRKALAKTKSIPETLVVAHDDSDIAMGSFKVSFGKSSGGHKGVQSVIDTLKTADFWRIRIGIRKSHNHAQHGIYKRKKAGEFVLARISKEDMKILYGVFPDAKKSVMENLYLSSDVG